MFVGFDIYIAVLVDPTFWIVVRNMFLWALITIPAQMLIGGTVAYFIERHTDSWRGFFRTMYFLPVVTSVSVISLYQPRRGGPLAAIFPPPVSGRYRARCAGRVAQW